MENFNKALGIKQVLSTAYYSQIDGQTERINQKSKHFCNTMLTISKTIGQNS